MRICAWSTLFFVLVALVLLVFFAAAAFQLQHYVEGRCTIAAKQLLWAIAAARTSIALALRKQATGVEIRF